LSWWSGKGWINHKAKGLRPTRKNGAYKD